MQLEWRYVMPSRGAGQSETVRGVFQFSLSSRHRLGVPLTEERIKLAFVCLFTAVGVPMIFAGDEFADQHDLSVSHPPKQRDAVNYGASMSHFDEEFSTTCPASSNSGSITEHWR
jgi:hypothetical protein